MEEKKMIVETRLSLVEFMAAVEAIADGYFDEAGNYTPHVGIINCMRLFYNLCVKDSEFEGEIPHDFQDAETVERLAASDAFIREFNRATLPNGAFPFDFANACIYANDLVDDRRDPLRKVVNDVKQIVKAMAQAADEMLSEENMELLKTLSQQLMDNASEPKSVLKPVGE